MSFQMQVNKAILQDAKHIPAKDRFPAKTQVKVSCGTDFYFSSETVDLTGFPELEPVTIEAECNRIGGGKGFIVIDVKAVAVAPFKK